MKYKGNFWSIKQLGYGEWKYEYNMWGDFISSWYQEGIEISKLVTGKRHFKGTKGLPKMYKNDAAIS